MFNICNLFRFKAWGGDDNDPHRRAEDVAYAVARFYQTGGTFQNYYMVSIFVFYLVLHNIYIEIKILYNICFLTSSSFYLIIQ